MTLHDAAMDRLGQWLRRAIRAGHAFAEDAWLHRAEGMWRRECRSIVFWGLLLPVVALAAAYFTWGEPAVAPRVSASRAKDIRGQPPTLWLASCRRLYAVACVAAKFPQALGLLTYHLNRLRGHRSGLIEYKGPSSRQAT